MKKLILSLFFLIFLNRTAFTACMAADADADVDLNFLENKLHHELIELIFMQFCDGDTDVSTYFTNASKALKSCGSLNKNFRRLLPTLIQQIKLKAKDKFARNLCGFDKFILDEKLRSVFDKAKNNIVINENELFSQAAALIIAGADPTITIETTGPSCHNLQVPILNYIARNNLFINLVPILVAYKVNINETDCIGNTALHYILLSKQSGESILAMIKLLVDHNVNVMATNNDDNTPLHLVIRRIISSTHEDKNKNIQILHILLDHYRLDIVSKIMCKIALDALSGYDGEDRELNLISSLSETDFCNNELPQADPRISELANEYVAKFLKGLILDNKS